MESSDPSELSILRAKLLDMTNDMRCIFGDCTRFLDRDEDDEVDWGSNGRDADSLFAAFAAVAGKWVDDTTCEHEPDWKSVCIAQDGDGIYIDVNCKKCGDSGCVGNAATLTAGIQWE